MSHEILKKKSDNLSAKTPSSESCADALVLSKGV
jgi:hypothetical protein